MKSFVLKILAQLFFIVIYIHSVQSASQNNQYYQNAPNSMEYDQNVYDFDSTDIYQTLHFQVWSI